MILHAHTLIPNIVLWSQPSPVMGYKRRRENRSLPCSASLNAAHRRKGALWPIPVDVSSYQWLQQSPHGTLATHGCMTGSIRLPSRRLMTYTTMFEPFARIYFFLPSPRIKRRVSSLLSPPNSWSSWLQIFLLGILYLSIPTYAGGLYSIGTDSVRNGPKSLQGQISIFLVGDEEDGYWSGPRQ